MQLIPGVRQAIVTPKQRVPEVTHEDVERIIHRDWPAQAAAALLIEIAAIEVREKPRVVLACLKTSGGDMKRLRNNLAEAAGYWRELISEAEYPEATKRWRPSTKISGEELDAMFERDWRQYSQWLGRAE